MPPKLGIFWIIQDDMPNAAADWVDKELVIDTNVVTSRKTDGLPAFCEAIVDMLQRTPVHAAM